MNSFWLHPSLILIFGALLLALAGGKPIAIGECGGLPTPEQLREQRYYCWFMAWSGMLMKENTAEQVKALYLDERTMNRPERRSAANG